MKIYGSQNIFAMISWWSIYVVNLHGNMDYVMIRSIMSKVTMKNMLYIRLYTSDKKCSGMLKHNSLIFVQLISLKDHITSSSFHRTILLSSTISELIWKLWILQSVGTNPERWISPSQGRYLHKTTQTEETQTYIHASSGIRTHYPSVRASEEISYLSTATLIGSILRKDLNLFYGYISIYWHLINLGISISRVLLRVHFINTDYGSYYLRSFIPFGTIFPSTHQNETRLQ
jgi:hypothetical protein